MKKLNSILFFCLLMLFYSCKKDKKEVEETTEDKTTTQEVIEVKKSHTLSFALNPKSDSGVSGNVTFSQKNDVVMMHATLSGLTAGKHAIHIHEKADCSSADGKSTGGHWNPTAQPHGKWGNETGYHKGDIGNFTAKEDGTAKIIFSTNEWCIGCGDETKDILGKALIVHQGVDDFTSQPSGAAGSRISCGGIIE